MRKILIIQGHSGLSSTLLFNSPEYGAYIFMNLGNTEYGGDSFELKFWLCRT